MHPAILVVSSEDYARHLQHRVDAPLEKILDYIDKNFSMVDGYTQPSEKDFPQIRSFVVMEVSTPRMLY